jgi:hypothetical protein
MNGALSKAWRGLFLIIALVRVLWEHKIIHHDNNVHALELLHYALSAVVIHIVTLNEDTGFLGSKLPYM